MSSASVGSFAVVTNNVALSDPTNLAQVDTISSGLSSASSAIGNIAAALFTGQQAPASDRDQVAQGLTDATNAVNSISSYVSSTRSTVLLVLIIRIFQYERASDEQREQVEDPARGCCHRRKRCREQLQLSVPATA